MASKRLEEIPLNTVSRKELERAHFVGSGLDAIIDPHEKAEQNDLALRLRNGIEKLEGREPYVLNSRFPENNSPPVQFKYIAKQFGVSRTRIQQIEQRALRKLRKPSISNKFRDYAPNFIPNRSYGKEDQVRVYFNGIVNACHQRQLSRALHNLAEAKVKPLPIADQTTKEAVVRLFEDPLYPILTDQMIDDYLKQFTISFIIQRKKIRDLEKGDSGLSQEIRRFDSLIRREFKVELEQFQASQPETVEEISPQSPVEPTVLPTTPRTFRLSEILRKVKRVVTSLFNKV